MAIRRAIQLLLCYGPLVAFWAVTVSGSVVAAFDVRDREQGRQVVVGSAVVMLFWLIQGWGFISLTVETRLIPPARFVWTLGFVALVVHILIAFGVAHGWSHAAAVEHVRKVGGFGGGIVVNYLFAAVWLADVVWWWISPTSHANRPRWVGWVVHGFLAFVVVNATVVFGTPVLRGGYALGLIWTLLWWLTAPAVFGLLWKWLKKTNEPGRGPGSGGAPQAAEVHSPT